MDIFFLKKNKIKKYMCVCVSNFSYFLIFLKLFEKTLIVLYF